MNRRKQMLILFPYTKKLEETVKKIPKVIHLG